MISKNKLLLKISDLEKQLKWKDAEMDIMKNDILIHLLKIKELNIIKEKWLNNCKKTKLYIDRIAELEADISDRIKYIAKLEDKIKTLDDVIMNAKLNLTIKDNEKGKMIKSIIEKNTKISKLEDKNIELQSNIITLEEENKKLREAACVGKMLSILGSNLDLMKENIQLEDKIDRISAILKED